MIDFVNCSKNYLIPADNVEPFWPVSIRQALFRPFSFLTKVEFLHVLFNIGGYYLHDFRRSLQTHWHLNRRSFCPFCPFLRLCSWFAL